MKHLLIIIGLIAASNGWSQKSDPFNALWYDGNAEIATYTLTESRYGELREGRRIMVFVTEPLRMSTLIKPDNTLSADSTVKVIKLNDTREFMTGIYNYSVMTSTFQAVEDKRYLKKGTAVKVAFTGQEWCGMVYEKLFRTEKNYSGNLFSYFESEGEKTYSIDATGDLMPEENLLIAVRELQGPVLMTGQEKAVKIIPTVWSRRKAHTAPASVTAVLRKGRETSIVTSLGRMNSVEFSWTAGANKTTVTVESAYPHRILAFTEPDGTTGSIIASKRVPYWALHANKDTHYRSALGLPSK